MSDTPETDKQKAYTTGFYRDATVPADFARKLERERDEAREALHAVERKNDQLVSALHSCVECLKGWQILFPEFPAPFTEEALWDAMKLLEAAK